MCNQLALFSDVEQAGGTPEWNGMMRPGPRCVGLEASPGPVRQARAGDPVSSIEAAERVERTGRAAGNRLAVLEAVRAWPGLTSAELAPLAGLERHEAARRLPEVEARGWIRRGEMKMQVVEGGGRRAVGVTWWPVEESLESGVRSLEEDRENTERGQA